MNNKLLDIQDIVFNQLKRISKDNMTIEELNYEISRSNAVSNNAITFIKTINTNIRIKELAEKYNITIDAIKKELGL